MSMWQRKINFSKIEFLNEGEGTRANFPMIKVFHIFAKNHLAKFIRDQLNGNRNIQGFALIRVVLFLKYEGFV